MHCVAVINQKGGVGKSTVVSYLGVLAQMDGFTTVVVETDRSASLAKWMRDRARKCSKPSPTLLIANDEENPEKLRQAVDKARAAGVEWLFIDTAAGIQATHSIAASVADLVLIPTTPSIRDQKVTADTVMLVRKEQKPGYLLITKGSQSNAANDKVAVGLSSAFGVPSLSTHILYRIPIQKADLRGETLLDMETTDSSALAGQSEYRALWQWLREHFEGPVAQAEE